MTVCSATRSRTDRVVVRSNTLLRTYLILTKARLTSLVLCTTAVGFVAAARTAGSMSWLGGLMEDLSRRQFTAFFLKVSELAGSSLLATFLWTILGTALAAGSANTLNQLYERSRDARMNRTRHRPLPMGVVSPAHAFLFGILLAYAGVFILAVFVNLLTAVLALANVLAYVLVYTPLKSRTTLNTLVGAICGGVPPMIGWAAYSGRIDPGAWLLGGILFVWQLPHFLSLAWLYREDYSRGGFCMLPEVDRDGALTARISVISSLLLVPLCLSAVLAGAGGYIFAVGALICTIWLTWLCVGFLRERSDQSARRAFLGSLLYLPVVMILMVIDPTAPVAGVRSSGVVVWPMIETGHSETP